VPNERIAATEVYEGAPEGDAQPPVTTVPFTDVDGRTTLTQLMECHSKELRDMIIESGMESGM
jgi:hypothetical protein